MRLIGAGQKRYFEIHTFGSNSPPSPGKVKFPTPGMAFQIKFPTPLACSGFARLHYLRAWNRLRLPGQSKHSNAWGLPGGVLMFRNDRRITAALTKPRLNSPLTRIDYLTPVTDTFSASRLCRLRELPLHP